MTRSPFWNRSARAFRTRSLALPVLLTLAMGSLALAGSAAAASSPQGTAGSGNSSTVPSQQECVVSTPAGVAWTSRTSAADNDWTSVVWGGPAGQEKFVAVATNGTGNRGPACQVPASALSCTVVGLDPQTDYYFTVVAMSAAGWGAASTPSNTVRPVAPEPPGPPTGVVAVPGDAQAAVSWSPPSSVGSSPIREYRVSSTPAAGTCVSTAMTCTVTGLVNGTAYTFTVEARSDQGWGPASPASGAVTPRAPGISIQGERSGQFVSITGTAVGMTSGAPVEVWVRLGESGSFVRAASTVTIDAGGAISWTRRVNPDKRVAVYLLGEGVQSNTVVLARTRPR